MSGIGLDQQSLEAFTSIGNLLSILVTVTIIIGAVGGLVRYLRKQVTKRVDVFRGEMKQEFTIISNQIKYSDKTIEQLEDRITRLENKLMMIDDKDEK